MTDSNRIGTLSEKRAICYFIEKGLDVFDSCQDTGPADLITFDPATGEVKCWEVKSENYRLSGPKKGNPISRSRRNKKFTKIINMIYVRKDGSIREGVRKIKNSKVRDKARDEEYQSGGAYRAMIKLFRNNLNELEKNKRKI